MSAILVVAEHEGGQLRQATLSAVTFARELAAKVGGEIAVLVMGDDVSAVAEALRGYGAARVRVAEDAALAGQVADRAAQVVVDAVRTEDAAWLVAASSTFSKDLLPRAAALLDAGMLTDVIAVEGEDADNLLFRRPMFAGNAIGAVRLAGPMRVLTVRATAYTPAAPIPGEASPVEPLPVDAAALPTGSEYGGLEGAARTSARPELTEARIVVTGGRPMKDPETYERLTGGLADLLGGAAGATRAAVDSGIAPNDLQVGQTGKIVAPDLYIALGVSGAIQHMAGMKDSKVVVAINKDPEAPIFDIADYGLVADIHQAVPQLIEEIRRVRGS
jgi:electron transfer flavoprotein alpha subunit